MGSQLLFPFMRESQPYSGKSCTIYLGPDSDSRTLTTIIPHYLGQKYITLRYTPRAVRYNSYSTSTI